jgi:DNA polymerase-3 subunit gamma/tau
MLQKIEVELLGVLRQSLNNYSIKFKFNVAKDDSERRPYTSIEVFAAMAKKNPTVLKLRDEFGLDTE